MKLKTLYSIFVVTALSVCMGSTSMHAQTANDDETYVYKNNTSTSSITGARYEVLREVDGGRPCFRIDKYTGEVWKLPYTVGVNARYYSCEKERSDNDVVIEDKINYQLIVDTTVHAILMNLNTGELWEYTEGLTERMSKFKLMKER